MKANLILSVDEIEIWATGQLSIQVLAFPFRLFQSEVDSN